MYELIDEMVGAFSQSIIDEGEDGEDAAGYAFEAFTENAEMLEEIATLYNNFELTEEEFEEELEDQRITLETQLLALVVIQKAMLQRAIDSALNIFRQSVGL
ncbi:MAG: hypothetical protein KJO81_02340 [Gammaproteobacteria bacterium]|nr:hypothetical protein [Gammaproteobacteria bacterium]